MTTTPSQIARDGSGRLLNNTTAQRMQYLTTIDSRVMSKRDRSEKRLFNAVHDLALRAGVASDFEERVFHIARKAVDARVFPGWEFSMVAAGALYYVILERDGYARPADVLRLVRSVRRERPESNLLAAYRRIVRVLGVAPRRASALDIALDVAERLRLPRKVIGPVRQVAAAMPDSGRPRIDAAAILYSACEAVGVKASQREIAEATGTTDVSLRSRLKETLVTQGSSTPADSGEPS
jgi:transcription initiation factor TFIIIB Brf1 subunit/transcription initiation factor TFIIB